MAARLHGGLEQRRDGDHSQRVRVLDVLNSADNECIRCEGHRENLPVPGLPSVLNATGRRSDCLLHLLGDKVAEDRV